MSVVLGFNDRWHEIRTIWLSNQWLYVLIGFLLGLLAFPFFQVLSTSFDDLLQGLIPEAVGIGFTIFFIDAMYQRRDEKREKDRLIRELNNQDSGIVMRAVEELRATGWLEDGSLFNARMGDTNLRGVNLKRANLNGVRFLTDSQLVQAQRLWKATMPDGKRYNGRFNLPADLARAKENHVDIHDPIQLAQDYGVTLEAYLDGQHWAKAHQSWLEEMRSKTDA